MLKLRVAFNDRKWCTTSSQNTSFLLFNNNEHSNTVIWQEQYLCCTTTLNFCNELISTYFFRLLRRWKDLRLFLCSKKDFFVFICMQSLTSVQFRLYSISVLLSECHKWSAATLALRRGLLSYWLFHWWRVKGSTAREPLPCIQPSPLSTRLDSAIFQVLTGMTWPEIEPSLPALVAHAQPTVPFRKLITKSVATIFGNSETNSNSLWLKLF